MKTDRSPISGRIEPGETEQAAVIRECFEEIDLIVKATRKIAKFEIDNGEARLNWWLVEIIDGKEILKNAAHTALGWFSLDEMKKMSDIQVVDLEIFESVENFI